MALEREQHLLSVLLQQKLINQQQAQHSWQILQQALQQKQSISLANILVSQGYVTARQLNSVVQKASRSSTAQMSAIVPATLPPAALASIAPTPASTPSPTATSAQKTTLPQQKKGAIEIGDHFGRYQIKQELGQGGMGAVYKAYDSQLNREVALKVILSGGGAKQIARFMTEARSMAKLEHPNIIKVYEVGDEPQNYFTMEYIEGQDLSSLIKKKVALQELAQIIKKCALALQDVHKTGIVHRDIKPANIMLNKQKDPKVMDFGLAKTGDTGLSKTGEMVGTPIYMPPEQTGSGKVDARSDVYSLGATLYEGLTKTPIFQGETVYNLINQILRKEPIAPRMLNPDIPVDLEAICLKCLEKNPQQRYKSAGLLAKDLENFLENRPVLAKPATRWVLLKKWMLRNKAIVATACAFVMVILVSLVIVVVAWQNEKKQKVIAKIALQEVQEEKKKTTAALTEAEKQRDIAKKREKEAKKAQEKTKAADAKKEKALETAVETIYYNQVTLAYNYAKDNDYLKSRAILNKKLSDEGFLEGLTTNRNLMERLRIKKQRLKHWEWSWLKQIGKQELFTLPTTKQLKKLRLSRDPDKMNWCAFSPDGKLVAGVNRQGWLAIWKVTGEIVANTYVNTFTSKKRTKRLDGCSFSPDSSQIAVLDFDGCLSLWDVNNLEHGPLKQMPYKKDGTSCVFHPNGKWVLCSYDGGYLILWDIVKGEKVWKIRGHKDDINFCTLSANGKLCATAGDGEGVASKGKVKVWRTKDGKLLTTFSNHIFDVASCSFSPHGKNIVSAGSGKSIILWEIKTGKTIWKIENAHRLAIKVVKFSHNGKYIVSGGEDRKLIIWDAKTGEKSKIFSGHQDVIYGCDISKDNNTIVTNSDDSRIKLWKLDSKAFPQVISQEAPVMFCTFSPDGKTIATAQKGSRNIELWDAATGEKKKTIYVGIGISLTNCIFHPNKNQLLCLALGQMSLYDLNTQVNIKSEISTKKSFLVGAYNFDGSKVLVAGNMKKIYLWDLEKKRFSFKKPKKTYKDKNRDNRADITGCHFHPKKKEMFITSREGNSGAIHIWKMGKKKPVGILGEGRIFPYQDRRSHEVNCSAFSRDGKLLVASKGTFLVLWDFSERKILKVFSGHTQEVTHCFFSPGNERIFSSSKDGVIKIWQTYAKGAKNEDSGFYEVEALLTINAHKGRIRGFAISPDGKTLVSGGEDKKIKIWRTK